MAVWHSFPKPCVHTARIYRFPNMLYKVLMTGAQLRKFMEFCAQFYNTFQPGDLTVSFNPAFKRFNYMMFSGVNYEINISKEPGERIEHLTWPDGTSVKDTDRFHAGVNYYCANSCLLHYGDVFREGDELSVLEETDIRSDLGGTVGSEYSNPYGEGRITIHGRD